MNMLIECEVLSAHYAAVRHNLHLAFLLFFKLLVVIAHIVKLKIE